MRTGLSIESAIADAETIRDALFALKLKIPAFGRCDLAYEYMIRGTSYVRGDLISMTTLPRRHTDLYLPGGGPNSDPVLENVGKKIEPFVIDLKELCGNKKSKYAKNPFFLSLLKSGRRYLAAFPFYSFDGIGRIILTVFADEAFLKQEYDADYFVDLGLQLHKSLKSNGLLRQYFDVEPKEALILARMADGKTAADVAQELVVTSRTIELRLQSARKKLKARTTTEAVFKSVAYGILPFNSGE